MGLKEYYKLASQVLETRVPYKSQGLKTRFLLAEFAASYLLSLLSWTGLCHIDLEFLIVKFKKT